MFLFSKNQSADKNKKAELKKDVIIYDYLTKLEDNLGKYKALYLYGHKLNGNSLRLLSRQALLKIFENVISKFKGEVFALPNDDMIVVYNKEAQEEVWACLIKIRYMLHDDPLMKDAFDLEQIGFIKYFDLNEGTKELHDTIDAAISDYRSPGRSLGEDYKAKPALSHEMVMGARKIRQELTTGMLAKVQKALAMTDFSSLIRRQSVCAVIGKSSPQVLFDEVFVSIADLRDMLMPDVDLTANPWLFLHLAGTLDKRVLVHVSKHDDGALTRNFSLNLNVSTILSDDFLLFDENINASMRSSVVLELQLVDIFSDIKAFMLAKTFAQYRGYKICIDGITVDKLKYINRTNLGADLIKIIWHPSFMEIVNEDKHFVDYVNRAERAKMILCRVDDPAAVEIGNSLGINLYQGRYIQRLLAKQSKKTFFSIRG